LNFLTGDDKKKAETVRQLLHLAEHGKLMIVISSFVIAEVRPHDGTKYKHIAAHSKKIEDLLETDRSYIRMVSLTRVISHLARQVSAKLLKQGHSISVPDSVHHATAIHQKVDCFRTWDGQYEKDNRRSGKLLACNGLVGTPALAIEEPVVHAGPLFDGTDVGILEPEGPPRTSQSAGSSI